MKDTKREIRIYSYPRAIESSLGCNMCRANFVGYDLETGTQVSMGVTEVALEPNSPGEVQRAIGYNLPIVYIYYTWKDSLSKDGLRKLRPYIIRPEDKDAVTAVIEKKHPNQRSRLLSLREIVAHLHGDCTV